LAFWKYFLPISARLNDYKRKYKREVTSLSAEAGRTRDGIKVTSRSGTITLLQDVYDTNSVRDSSKREPADVDSKIHIGDTSHNLSNKENRKHLSAFTFFVSRNNLWENMIGPLCRHEADRIRVRLELDEITRKAILRVREDFMI